MQLDATFSFNFNISYLKNKSTRKERIQIAIAGSAVMLKKETYAIPSFEKH